VEQYLPHLRAAGMSCTVESAIGESDFVRFTGPDRQGRALWYHAKETPRRLVQVLGAWRYDVVFLQKAIMTASLRGMDRLLRSRARRLVYDIDDAVHLAPPHPLRGVWQRLEDLEQNRTMLIASDKVLAGNNWLRETARSCGGNATMFPTVVDTDRFVPAKEPPTQYCVGWIGGPSTTPHLSVAAAIVETYDQTDRSDPAVPSIRLIGADPKHVPWTSAQIIPWSLETEVSEIQQFSVGIMPLPKDDWSRGKCALKALQYMACGVPCVATPHGAISDIIRDGENGLIADSPGQWRESIERLRDPALRRRLGEAGRATVEKDYSLRVWAPRMRDELEAVA
jgi:glycosyltransferase involved in cell wall biosynthesis